MYFQKPITSSIEWNSLYVKAKKKIQISTLSQTIKIKKKLKGKIIKDKGQISKHDN